MMDPVSSGFESNAFAAVDIECATGYYSFGHEMGHNMGARHDWYVDDLKTPYGYAHGYVNYDNPGDRWRTIMAYNNECDKQGVYCYRIPYWSNPAVLRNGAPMGVPDGTSTSCVANVLHPHCDADNHKTLNNTAYTVANFRASIPQTPAAPGSLSALGISQTRIDLSWSDNSFDESGFKIERAPAGTGNWGQIATVGANVETYANTGLSPDTAYDYRVRAYNSAGDSAYSNVASASTLPPPPAAPSNLTATAISQTRIDLAWSDNSSDESGFKIERALSAGGPWSQIATVGANVTSFSNTGLSPDTGYYYRVRAYNFYGNSAYSNVASAATPPVVGPVVVFGYTVDDDNSGGSSGNGDGRIDCGETVQLYVDLKNLGGGLAQDVQATISSPSTYANWLDSSSAYGDIGAGLVVRNTDTFDLEVSPSTPHGHLLQFDLEISALDGGPWSGSFATMVRCGGPIYNMYLPLVASRQTATAGFNSQFNGSAPGWQVHSGSWWIDNSAWYRTDGLSGAWASASYGATYAELDYRARIWREGCGNCAQGLLVRGSPDPLGGQNTWDSGYGFFISRDGRYAILNYTGGVGAALQPWTSSTAIAQGGAWNELRVVAAGSTLSFYINDALLWVGSNAAHASGRVGLAMYRDSSSTGNILWVDWATLTPQATAADPQEVSPEQRALNEAAREQDELGSDGRAPAR
jgi:hypothetical protein